MGGTELKLNDDAASKTFTLFTPAEVTDGIRKDIRELKVKLFDLEAKVNSR
ncbi:hypothetical protein [Paenibacillus medicaginis]|uniref:Uncharacterized protein n=1 Tax=Paenibacillus medicaginis TaxID=1470560 RepID=A0ABV5C3F7_9BACL